jgi:hypothetical protein
VCFVDTQAARSLREQLSDEHSKLKSGQITRRIESLLFPDEGGHGVLRFAAAQRFSCCFCCQVALCAHIKTHLDADFLRFVFLSQVLRR